MAPQRVYTLDALETRALQSFPHAYKKISETPYTFVSQDLAEVTTPAATDLLQVAYWNFKRNNVPVLASISPDGSSITLLYYKKEEGLVDAGMSYPEGRSNIQACVPPFKYIPPRKWPENISERQEAQKNATEQLALSIEFAFLYTGRIKDITSEAETDLHVMFEQLCGKMPDADYDTEDDMEPEPASTSRPSAKALGKRRAVEVSPVDECAAAYARLSTYFLPSLIAPY